MKIPFVYLLINFTYISFSHRWASEFLSSVQIFIRIIQFQIKYVLVLPQIGYKFKSFFYNNMTFCIACGTYFNFLMYLELILMLETVWAILFLRRNYYVAGLSIGLMRRFKRNPSSSPRSHLLHKMYIFCILYFFETYLFCEIFTVENNMKILPFVTAIRALYSQEAGFDGFFQKQVYRRKMKIFENFWKFLKHMS